MPIIEMQSCTPREAAISIAAKLITRDRNGLLHLDTSIAPRGWFWRHSKNDFSVMLVNTMNRAGDVPNGATPILQNEILAHLNF